MICPKCASESDAGLAECPRCGVVFARARRRLDAPPDARAVPAALDADARKALLIGGAAAVVLLAVPFLRFLFSPLSTLVHEIGHSLASWLFGYPAIPSFDFVYGGGWSLRSDRSGAVVLLLLAAFGGACWWWRAHRRALVVLGCVGAAWLVLAISPWHDTVIAFMGHGGELVFAGLFLYRGLSGRSCRIAAERPLYVAFGAFMLLRVVAFSWDLVAHEASRAEYEEGKGEVLNDLHDIALDLHGRLGLPVGTREVALLLLACCAIPPVVAWQWSRHRDAIHERLVRTFGRESE